MASGIGSGISSLLPFLAFAARGGRIGRADGGPLPGDDPTTPSAPLHDSDATPVAAAADDDTAPAPQPGGFGKAAQPPAGGGGGGGGGFLGSLFHGVEKLGQGVAGMAGYEGHGQWNRDQVVPFVTGIADMLAAPTKYPLVALTQGLKGGAQSYMQQQQQETQLGLANAQAEQARYQAQPMAVRDLMGELPGPAHNPDGTPDYAHSYQIRHGVWAHHATADELLAGGGQGGGAAGPGAPGAGGATMVSQQGEVSAAGAPATQQGVVARGPIKVDYAHGTQSFAPSATSDQFVNGLFRGNADTSGTAQGAMHNRVQISLHGLGASEAAAQKSYDTDQANQSGYQTSSRQLQMLAQAVNAIPKGGLGAMGEGSDERQTLLKLAQTANRVIGGQDDPSINEQTSSADLIRKIEGLASTQLTQQAGLHAQGVQQMLQSVLPGSGSANVGVANHMIANMMIANQQLIDKPAFEQAYTAKYGTVLGADQAFQSETQAMYGDDQTQLERMMLRGKSGESIAEHLMKNPGSRRQIEMGVRQGQQYNPGVGVGLGRYWTERM